MNSKEFSLTIENIVKEKKYLTWTECYGIVNKMV